MLSRGYRPLNLEDGAIIYAVLWHQTVPKVWILLNYAERAKLVHVNNIVAFKRYS